MADSDQIPQQELPDLGTLTIVPLELFNHSAMPDSNLAPQQELPDLGTLATLPMELPNHLVMSESNQIPEQELLDLGTLKILPIELLNPLVMADSSTALEKAPPDLGTLSILPIELRNKIIRQSLDVTIAINDDGSEGKHAGRQALPPALERDMQVMGGLPIEACTYIIRSPAAFHAFYDRLSAHDRRRLRSLRLVLFGFFRPENPLNGNASIRHIDERRLARRFSYSARNSSGHRSRRD